MCDLETYDTKPTAVILSIGACVMDPESGEIKDRFYRSIDMESCQAAGLTTSESTKKWWSQQSEEARSVFTDPGRVALFQALQDFSVFLRMQQGGPTKVKLWGNGSDFDNVILSNAYEAMNFDAPWRFYNNRCYRTIKSCMKHLFVEPAREGTYHNALDDAVHQATGLLQIRKNISWM
jgi:exodeoxyribonuclease VIII